MPTLNPDIPCDVYRNLLRRTVSLRQSGKVVGYAQNVTVRDVVFRVAPAGVARIRRRHEREVVAYARGVVTYTGDAPDVPEGAQRVCFDPFQHDTFVLADGTPVHRADLFGMTSPCGSWVVNPS